MGAKKDLKKARNLIRDVGFAQRMFVNVDADGNPTCYCSMGALNKVVYDNPYGGDEDEERNRRWGKAFTRLRRTLANLSGGEYYSIPGYNDHHTKEEVLALFDRAIKGDKA